MSRSDGTDGRAHVRYGAESVYVVGTTPQESGVPVSGERRRRTLRADPRFVAKTSAHQQLRLCVEPHSWEELAAAKEFHLSAGRRR